LRALQDVRDVVAVALLTRGDGALHALDGMLGQQLQDADVLPRAGRGTMLFFQGLPQVAEHRRQLPVLVNVGVVQRRRLARQRHQVMQRVEHLHALGVTPGVAGDDLATRHHLDALDIGLHRDRAEGVRARHAVGVVIETHRLVFVHLGRLGYAGVERSRRQRQGQGTLALEALADALLLPRLLALSVAQAASPQSSVELG
jgi:hypothetical protein